MPVTTTDRTPTAPSRVTGWDHAAIGMLALASFALSYDALRQMAIGIHVRGPLTFAFPLIIDGFIAYSVRALLLLRTAALTARAYVWFLFLASTAASIWANTLHAVRLNQQTVATSGHLHLGDQSVGLLSMVAPLALAGAVHLGIVTSRHSGPAAPTGPVATGPAESADGPSPDSSARREPSGTATAPPGDADRAVPAPLGADGPSADHGPVRDPDQTWDGDRPAGSADLPWTVPGSAEHERSQEPGASECAGQRPSGNSAQAQGTKPAGRPPGASLDELVAIGREAWTATGRLSRSVVRDAVRARGVTLSDRRLTEVMAVLRTDVEKDRQPGLD